MSATIPTDAAIASESTQADAAVNRASPGEASPVAIGRERARGRFSRSTATSTRSLRLTANTTKGTTTSIARRVGIGSSAEPTDAAPIAALSATSRRRGGRASTTKSRTCRAALLAMAITCCSTTGSGPTTGARRRRRRRGRRPSECRPARRRPIAATSAALVARRWTRPSAAVHRASQACARPCALTSEPSWQPVDTVPSHVVGSLLRVGASGASAVRSSGRTRHGRRGRGRQSSRHGVDAPSSLGSSSGVDPDRGSRQSAARAPELERGDSWRVEAEDLAVEGQAASRASTSLALAEPVRLPS